MDSKFDLFISYNSEDQAIVKALAVQLQSRQLNVFLDRWHLIPGQPWPERLCSVLSSCSAVVVCIGTGEMGHWQQREMYFALERQSREPEFRVIPLLLPNAIPPLGFLGQNMWVDFRGGIDEPMAFNILLAAIRREKLDSMLLERLQEVNNAICPYRGLNVFQEQDAAFFFGRDVAINELNNKLQRQNFVALVGASGAGKSSVVRAGLLPLLRKDTKEPWEIVTIVPGDRPLYNLATVLVPLLENNLGESAFLSEIGKQANHFLDGTVQIRDVVERILKKQPGTARFLLVVDQWEELYTLAKSEFKSGGDETQSLITNENTQARRFIDGVLDASEAGVLSVIITLRGDFMGHAISYRRLSDHLQNTQINLGPMLQKELQLAIEEPAKKVNISFEPGLVDLLLTDVGDEPGNLPLLEYVLERLWDNKKKWGGVFRFQAYRDMDRLEGALAQKANDIYKSLSAPDRQQLQKILLQLVYTSENSDYTRRRANLGDLGSNAQEIIKRLIQERLLVVNQDKKSGQNTVEVAHEALIRHWPQFQQWLKDDRDFLIWRERLRNAHDEWQRSQDPEVLLGGQRLLDAKDWFNRKENELNEQEIDFIQCSISRLFWVRARMISIIILPLALVGWLFIWSNSNGFSPKTVWYVLLAKTGIYILKPEMVSLPNDKDCQKEACEFLMGSSESDPKFDESEHPQHVVHFKKPFKIGRHEVTFDEYQVFAYLIEGNGGCDDNHKIGAINDNGWGKRSRPVINVSWHDAQCYAKWLSKKTGRYYRLPTEAEWEYAARAGTANEYYWGQQEAKDYVWFTDNSEGVTHPVGEKKPNAFGLYDMSGNVWEWVQDCYAVNYTQAPKDGSALELNNCVQRVLRGGSWYDEPDRLRSVTRNGYSPDSGMNDFGFRLAQD